MKLSRFILSFAVTAVLLCSAAVGAEKHKGTLHLYDKVSLDGKVLAPGTYNVEWTGDGPSVQVTILKDKQTVATFSAHCAELATASRANAVGTENSVDGTPTLKALYFDGKKYSLQVEQTQASRPSN